MLDSPISTPGPLSLQVLRETFLSGWRTKCGKIREAAGAVGGPQVKLDAPEMPPRPPHV